jgi:hypothetical protein
VRYDISISVIFPQKIWGVNKESFLSQQCHWYLCDQNRRIVFDFLREFEAIFKRALIHISGAIYSCLIKKEIVNHVSNSLP